MKTKQIVLVWDGFIRFYHWLQLLLVIGLWLSIKLDEVDLHMLFGLALLTLLVTRIVWGLIGSSTALFKSLRLHPKGAYNEIENELKGKVSLHSGHSYLGSYMVLALWALLSIQLISGLFNSDDILSDGPLYAFVSESSYDWFKAIHASNVNYLFGLIALHVVTIAYFSFRKRGYLNAMLTGYKVLNVAMKPSLKRGVWPIIVACLLMGIVLMI
ncbi:cytochrome b/b6 domain-containing protein [Agarivorans aestuarii]|uniref:cytochrome b/b6 domain-containing protein n=1 Tax=Agarivorans aestuarii TaxID=1563703 RepID=UPI001C81E5EE|nr:cytochrome b/b6 domain-containing protein [Agarivorans aestuarii]